MKIVWTAPAHRDFMHVFEYVSAENPGAAGDLAETIIEAIENLRSFPLLGRSGRVAGTRELIIPETPYYVPYRIKGQEIQILGVIHGARKWPD